MRINNILSFPFLSLKHLNVKCLGVKVKTIFDCLQPKRKHNSDSEEGLFDLEINNINIKKASLNIIVLIKKYLKIPMKKKTIFNLPLKQINFKTA